MGVRMSRYDRENEAEGSARLEHNMVGRTALNYRLARLRQKGKVGEPIAMKDFQFLRQYQAFLNPEQSAVVERYMALCISAALNNFNRIQNGEVDEAASAAALAGAASSSSCTALVSASSSSVVSACSAVVQLEKQASSTIGADAHEHLLGFFSKKQ